MLTNTLDLVYNLAILVALSVISGFLRQHRSHKAWGPVLQGLLFGGAAVVGMTHPLVLGPGLIFDGRSVMISLCGLFFGPLAVGIAGGMAVVHRIALGGTGVHMGWLVITASALLGLVFHRKWTLTGANLSVGRLLGFGLAVHVAMVLLMFTLPAGAGLGVIKRLGLPILLVYPVATLLIGKVLSAQAAGIRTVEALRESEAKYRMMVRYSSDPIFAFNPDETYHYVNEAFARAFHKTPEEIIGKTPHAIFPHEEAEKRLTAVRRVFKTGLPEEIEVKVVTPSGEVKWYLTMADLTKSEDGQNSIVSCISKDITERKEREQERAASLRALQHQRRIDQIIQVAGVQEQEAMNEQILEALLDIFAADRVWLLHPADPEAGSWTAPIEKTVAAYPGILVKGRQVPMSDPSRKFFRTVLASTQPLAFGPGQEHPMPPEIAEGFAVQSMLVLALILKQGPPWILGMHQCSHARVWTGGDWSLFAQIGMRLTDGMNAMLFLRQLRASEARHRLLADNIIDVIWTMDLQGRFTYVSPSVAKLRGFTPEEVLDQSIDEVLTADSARIAHKGMSAALAQLASSGAFPTFQGELEQPCKDGSTVWTDVTTSGFSDEAGRVVGIVGVTRDISQRRKAEAERRALEFQLQQSQKMESLGVLAGGVAHDMNNVLGAILGMASAHIGTQPNGSPIYQALDTICKATERGGKMVKSLLSFARQTPAENHELDMNAILREQVSFLQRTTLAKVHLQMDLEPDLRPILGDASALTHAFMNLCVNAVDAMSENGTLTLRTQNVDDDWIEVRVEDTGSGMSKEVLARATDPFFTTKEVGKGTGLGLSMVFGTVSAHRGQLEIQSEPGQGTRVMIRFPAFEAVPQAPEPELEPQTAPTPHSLKVLVVDDDELIQSSMLALLDVLGHSATGVSCGEEALGKLEAGFQPDVVILDLNMPGLGGAGTLPRLRVLNPTVPVLLATGRVDQYATDLAGAHPQVTLLPKPFSTGELQQSLELFGRK
jgi:PAS domain S-box-containing protein